MARARFQLNVATKAIKSSESWSSSSMQPSPWHEKENEVLTESDNEAINDYKQQWEATPQALLLELAPFLRCSSPKKGLAALPDLETLRISKPSRNANSSDTNLLAALDADKILTRDLVGPFFSVDVECVATGTGYGDRDVARIAVVDENEVTLFDSYVKPDKPIVSYLTQLTGITAEHLNAANSLADVMADLKKVLPSQCVLVGQSVDKDAHWLGLQPAVDFRVLFNVADLFRVPTTSKSYNYRYFSLRHVAKYLLEATIQESDHDPVVDAVYAMKIFKRFRYLHESSGHRQAVLQTLLKTPRTPSFAERFPVLDGVLMARPKEERGALMD
ncbi:hypothetical protein DYB38_005675 [Aphanomyces astaci]|uniref:Exonuclease domain-containing protein n=1 Tax=Aphanomyces astaci TaxID=112090 RepID=A0A397CMF4_APHAT|nr:hypothetical protein DYB38_005675 [Aphanomyces astaci]